MKQKILHRVIVDLLSKSSLLLLVLLPFILYFSFEMTLNLLALLFFVLLSSLGIGGLLIMYRKEYAIHALTAMGLSAGAYVIGIALHGDLLYDDFSSSAFFAFLFLGLLFILTPPIFITLNTLKVKQSSKRSNRRQKWNRKA